MNNKIVRGVIVTIMILSLLSALASCGIVPTEKTAETMEALPKEELFATFQEAAESWAAENKENHVVKAQLMEIQVDPLLMDHGNNIRLSNNTDLVFTVTVSKDQKNEDGWGTLYEGFRRKVFAFDRSSCVHGIQVRFENEEGQYRYDKGFASPDLVISIDSNPHPARTIPQDELYVQTLFYNELQQIIKEANGQEEDYTFRISLLRFGYEEESGDLIAEIGVIDEIYETQKQEEAWSHISSMAERLVLALQNDPQGAQYLTEQVIHAIDISVRTPGIKEQYQYSLYKEL
ncbi:MAG: hypothetical protein HUJ80_03875 [Firmicutes bacterium]|nr:hypothetical protein [Bacillota bacterium]